MDRSTGTVLNFGNITFCFWRYSFVLVFTISMTELINSFLACYFARALGATFSFIYIPIFMTLCNVFGFNIFPRGKFFALSLRRSSFGVVRLHGVFTMGDLVSFLRAMGRNMSNFVTYITCSSFPLFFTRTTGALCRIVALWKLRSQGRPLMISHKGRVLLLEPCDQWNWTILAVVNVSSDGLGISKFEIAFKLLHQI
jgi:hypothetical protein